MDEENELTLREHLEELRVRLVWSVIGIAITTVIAFLFVTRELVDFLKADVPADVGFIFTGMIEGWSTYLKVSLYCGIAIALPFLVYQAVMFVRPGLTKREAAYTYISLPVVAGLFVAGVTFTYILFLPNALAFLTSSEFLGDTMGEPMLTIGKYISDVTKLLFGVGLMFETPLVMLLLAKLGVVTPGGMLRKWRYAVVIAFAAAAVITPTWDPINCSIVAGPLVALYFLGILLAWIAVGGKKDEDAVALEEA